MSKTIYYIGVGASYGIREKGKIVEGIPVVKEIPREFDTFKQFIETAEILDGRFSSRICTVWNTTMWRVQRGICFMILTV